MSKEIDVQQELRKLEGRMEEGLKTLQETMTEQRKVVDEFVKAKPYVALGVVFVAGLTLGALAGLLTKSKD